LEPLGLSQRQERITCRLRHFARHPASNAITQKTPFPGLVPTPVASTEAVGTGLDTESSPAGSLRRRWRLPPGLDWRPFGTAQSSNERTKIRKTGAKSPALKKSRTDDAGFPQPMELPECDACEAVGHIREPSGILLTTFTILRLREFQPFGFRAATGPKPPHAAIAIGHRTGTARKRPPVNCDERQNTLQQSSCDVLPPIESRSRTK
jgi:hypothetical protein